MKYIGLLLTVVIMSACQNNAHSEIYDTHMTLNSELVVLQSENIALKNQLSALQNPTEPDENPVELDRYLSMIETLVAALTRELGTINETLNQTESHSIALAYSEVQTSITRINQTLDNFNTEVASLSLSESQDNHFEGLNSANEELREILEVLRRAVETNNITDVSAARERLANLDNKY